MKSKLTYIYFLHKGDNIPFYIGKSVNKKLHRSYQHKKKYGKDTLIEILDIVKSKDWIFWEKYWISQIKVWGFKLENKNDGGGGSIKLSSEAKQIKSNKMKDNWDKGNFKRKWDKPVKNNKTGVIYKTIKELMVDNNIGNRSYSCFYNNVGENKKFSYL
jgi:hypothetical protein